jgi:hypothetical protein
MVAGVVMGCSKVNQLRSKDMKNSSPDLRARLERRHIAEITHLAACAIRTGRLELPRKEK